MLPYILRPTRTYGTKAKGRDNSQTLQNAIQDDLRQFQTLFLTELKQTEINNNHHRQQHWESGKAFGIFKRLFGSCKIALLHLLVPLKCDQEAHSQLIYAACLDLLRQALLSAAPLELFSNAVFSVFCLYTLMETNPLPRGTTQQHGLELLPVGLRSKVDPNRLFRRFFSQNIRIDRQHYLLLLRLREMALATHADCRQQQFYFQSSTTVYETQQQQQQQQQQSTWVCRCGMARDVVEILDRLSSKLDYCEYTGPVGLEAFAGHPDYPYAQTNNNTASSSSSLPITTTIPQTTTTTTTTSPPDESLMVDNEQPPFEYSDTLSTLMGQYHSSIQSIRLPQQKSYTTTQLKRRLDPFFSLLENNESWADTRARLFHSGENQNKDVRNKTTAVQHNRSLQRKERARMAMEEHIKTTSNDDDDDDDDDNDDLAGGWNRPQEQKEETERTKGTIEETPLPSYEMILSSDISPQMQDQLQKSVQFLVRRDGLAPPKIEEPPPKQAPKQHAADDISSIGVGGVSVATTAQGRRALQALLSEAHNNNEQPTIIPRVASIPKRQQIMIPQTRMAMFLSADQAIMGSHASDDDDDGEASDVSNLSFSDHEGDDDDDGASAATSAVGRRALETLLSKVTRVGNSSKPQKRKANKTTKLLKSTPRRSRKGPKRRRVVVAENTSVASSVGQGRAALENLLGEVKGRGAIDENASGVSSVGQGRAALNKLLEQTAGLAAGTGIHDSTMDDDSKQTNSNFSGQEMRNRKVTRTPDRPKKSFRVTGRRKGVRDSQNVEETDVFIGRKTKLSTVEDESITSRPGTKALNALVSKAVDTAHKDSNRGQKPTRMSERQAAKKRKKPKGNIVKETGPNTRSQGKKDCPSVTSSVEPGRNALEALLSQSFQKKAEASSEE